MTNHEIALLEIIETAIEYKLDYIKKNVSKQNNSTELPST